MTPSVRTLQTIHCSVCVARFGESHGIYTYIYIYIYQICIRYPVEPKKQHKLIGPVEYLYSAADRAEQAARTTDRLLNSALAQIQIQNLVGG